MSKSKCPESKIMRDGFGIPHETISNFMAILNEDDYVGILSYSEGCKFATAAIAMYIEDEYGLYNLDKLKLAMELHFRNT